jgi:hypothetical protein
MNPMAMMMQMMQMMINSMDATAGGVGTSSAPGGGRICNPGEGSNVIGGNEMPDPSKFFAAMAAAAAASTAGVKPKVEGPQLPVNQPGTPGLSSFP